MSNLLSQASLVMIPSGYKEDVVYSQIPTDGSGDLSFTRASNGTRVNSAGLVEVAPWNLLQYSEDFSNAVWTKTNVALTAGQADPNGGTTATTIDPTNTTSSFIRENINITIGSTYTWSVYIKGSTTGQNIALYTDGASNVYEVKAITTSWQRINIVATATSSGSSGFYILCGGGYSMTDLPFNVAFAQVNIGSTAKPYFPTTDRLNVPRLTYQNGGGGCPSLLLEKQSTNLFTYSEQFDNGDWVKYGGNTVTANNTTSPDGTQNADKMDSVGGIYVQKTFTANTAYTISVFIKKDTATSFSINYIDQSGPYRGGTITYAFATGIITVTQSANSSVSGEAVNYGNGWIRLILKMTTNVSANYNYQQFDFDGGDGWLWGAQLEASSYPTSYIPTTSSSATRVADACVKTGISSLIGQSEGFIAGEVYGLTSAYGALSTIMSVSDGTTQNRVMFSFNPSTGYLTPRIYKAGSTIFVQDYYLGDLTQKIKFAIGWGGGRAVCYVNGTQVQETTGLTFFSSGTLTRLGADQGDGGSIGIGKVSEYILGTTNLTNSQLQSLTL